MPRIEYENYNPSADSRILIHNCNIIIEDYLAQGFTLTLRQLYYQLVSRDLVENTQRSYKRVGDIVSRARRAGLMDWNAIEDRTRNLRSSTHWTRPVDIVRAAAKQYRIDLWDRQACRPEVWIEKDALVGVIERACIALDVPYFSTRGYSSDSEVWRAAQRYQDYEDRGQTPVIIHLSDHDPSGIDMTRDIADRIMLFHDAGGGWQVERIALTMKQIEEHRPPPNPAKMTDSRIAGYLDRYGASSWELDALSPDTIDNLLRTTIDLYIEQDAWDEARAEQDAHRREIESVASQFKDVD